MTRFLIDTVIVASLMMGSSACSATGGGSPTGPSGPSGSTGSAVISGTVVGRQLTAAAKLGMALDSASTMTVSVEGTNITVTVDATGHFEISGAPAGEVQLLFKDGASSWAVIITGVGAEEVIQIQINLSGGAATIVSQTRSNAKTRLCHRTESGSYQLIDISISAEATHRAHGDAAVGEPVPADQTKVFDANCRPVVPSIRLVKSTNGEDANEAPGPSIKVGNTVTWTYLVTNNGLVQLSNVAVSDDQGVLVGCPGNTLASGASMTCTGTGVAVAGQYSNIGTATATVDGTGEQVTHSDSSHYFGEEADPDGPTGPKVSLCHKKGKGRYQLISVGASAEPAHRAHGDAKPGEPVPSEPGKTFGADCTF